MAEIDWVTTIFIVGVFVVLIWSMVYIVGPTERAVIIRLGRIVGTAEPGLGFKLPFLDYVYKFNYAVQTQDFIHDNAVTVLSKDGLPVTLDVSIIYRLSASPDVLYKTFAGTQRLQSWFVAKARGTVRDVVAKYNVEALYSENRERVAHEILAELEDLVSPYIEVEDVQVRRVVLPEQVVKAIEEKLKAQQEAQRMQYVIQKEKLEMQRKKIEAEAIASATEIIAQALNKNPGYLKWYYMKVLERFAETNNNTIILVPVNAGLFPDVNGYVESSIGAGMLLNVGR